MLKVMYGGERRSVARSSLARYGSIKAMHGQRWLGGDLRGSALSSPVRQGIFWLGEAESSVDGHGMAKFGTVGFGEIFHGEALYCIAL